MVCRICNSSSIETFKAREMMFGTRDCFPYFICHACGCIQIAEIPDDLSPYYAGEYYSFKPILPRNFISSLFHRIKDNSAVFRRGRIGRFLNRFFGNIYLEQFALLQPKHSMAILDVGCGSGHFLYSLREIGFTHLLGIDPHLTSNLKYTNGLELRRISIDELSGSYDIITLNHSFEHVENPQSTLKNCNRLLNHGGFCCLTTPIASSFAFKTYGSNWVQLDAPRHLHIHTHRSMEHLAKECGFQFWKVIYNSGAFQFWGSEQYAMDMPLVDARSYGNNRHLSLFTDREIADFHLASRYLNAVRQGDQATFFLLKP